MDHRTPGGATMGEPLLWRQPEKTEQAPGQPAGRRPLGQCPQGRAPERKRIMEANSGATLTAEHQGQEAGGRGHRREWHTSWAEIQKPLSGTHPRDLQLPIRKAWSLAHAWEQQCRNRKSGKHQTNCMHHASPSRPTGQETTKAERQQLEQDQQPSLGGCYNRATSPRGQEPRSRSHRIQPEKAAP
ncbi:hypothetical protein NDU88_007261 [Pleurodeles waltl]|uniref:Uncharacterized protein n=1 Tax=Pleurodeles waltl TaxID=8319 RepID=A0AAV7VTX3_PLEWA|nr:hypothetical protein NDU88_007261 [Pleurodeles waltl]